MIKELTLLVGNIASGKSTWCRQQSRKGDLVINDDSLTNMLHGGNYDIYRENLFTLYKSIETTLLIQLLQSGYGVIIDRPCETAVTRSRYIQLAHLMRYTVTVVVFPWETPIVHARRRCIDDPRGHGLDYWVDVAAHKAEIYQEPDREAEGFDHINYLKSDDHAKG